MYALFLISLTYKWFSYGHISVKSQSHCVYESAPTFTVKHGYGFTNVTIFFSFDSVNRNHVKRIQNVLCDWNVSRSLGMSIECIVVSLQYPGEIIHSYGSLSQKAPKHESDRSGEWDKSRRSVSLGKNCSWLCRSQIIMFWVKVKGIYKLPHHYNFSKLK